MKRLKRVVRHEARMRMSNTENLRKLAFQRIRRAFQDGRLTVAEAEQLRREFWDERLNDRLIARGAR